MAEGVNKVKLKLPPKSGTGTVTETVTERADHFIRGNILVTVVIVIAIICIFAIWLIGSQRGDSIFSGLRVPIGFPRYVIRNIFTTFAIIMLTIGVIFSFKNTKDFDNTIIIVMYILFLGLVIGLESNIQNREDWDGAALTAPIMLLALAFIVFFTWKNALWTRVLLLLSVIWFIFLTLEVLALKSMNGSKNSQ